jgi:mono/diheme cytochrome c family protein
LIFHRLSIFIVVAALTALLWLPKTTLGADKPAVYTAAQATQGAALFANSCAGCHGQNLEGTAAPALSGAAFMRSWNGKSADDLFYTISHDMPLDNPGSLKPDEYLSILSFVLQKNGYPAGTSPLSASQLKQITITP